MIFPHLTPVSKLVELAKAGEASRDWYCRASIEIRHAATCLSISPRLLADLLAIHSPRVSVLKSIRQTLYFVRAGEPRFDVMRSIRTSLDFYLRTGRILGPKTLPFSRALLGCPSSIVLDTHMATAFNCNPRLFSNRRFHRLCCYRIIDTASILDWTYAETQAAIWSALVSGPSSNPVRYLTIRSEL